MKFKAKIAKASIQTDEDITQQIETARNHFFAAKDSAIEAAAHAALIWRKTKRNNGAAEFVENEINRLNEEIRLHNEAMDDKRAQEETRLRVQFAKDATGDELEQLVSAGLPNEAVWELGRKVEIEAKNGASPATLIVKFIFRFDKAGDASNTSRYSAALEWIETNCAAANDVADIVSSVKAAGGFDKVVGLQRLVRKSSSVVQSNSEADDNDGADEDAGSAQVPAVDWTATSPALKAFRLKLPNQPDGLVLLLGRYQSGKVEIIKTSPIPEDALATVVNYFNAPTGASAEPQPQSSEKIAA